MSDPIKPQSTPPCFEQDYRLVDRIKRDINNGAQLIGTLMTQLDEAEARADRHRRALLDILRVRMQYAESADAANAALEIARKALAE
jgi:hypothetical protein